MNEKEFREQYGKLKFQEMLERDEEKRKIVSKKIKTLESTYKRDVINGMLNEIDNTDEVTNEITGGNIK